jgi:hypothetical protein
MKSIIWWTYDPTVYIFYLFSSFSHMIPMYLSTADVNIALLSSYNVINTFVYLQVEIQQKCPMYV